MNVTGWALSLSAVMIIFAIAEMMLPAGKTKKTAQTVFSLIVTLTVLAPTISFLRGGRDLELGDTEYYEIDTRFVEQTFEMTKSIYNKEIFETLKFYKIENISKVECLPDDEGRKIKSVQIFYDESGIIQADLHKYITEIKTVVARVYNLDEEVISVSGG